MRSKFILLILLFSFNPQILKASNMQFDHFTQDIIFKWAEKTYPELFNTQQGSAKIVHWNKWIYKHYRSTGNYIALKEQKSNRLGVKNVYFLEPATNNQLVAVGTDEEILRKINNTDDKLRVDRLVFSTEQCREIPLLGTIGKTVDFIGTEELDLSRGSIIIFNLLERTKDKLYFNLFNILSGRKTIIVSYKDQTLDGEDFRTLDYPQYNTLFDKLDEDNLGNADNLLNFILPTLLPKKWCQNMSWQYMMKSDFFIRRDTIISINENIYLADGTLRKTVLLASSLKSSTETRSLLTWFDIETGYPLRIMPSHTVFSSSLSSSLFLVLGFLDTSITETDKNREYPPIAVFD